MSKRRKAPSDAPGSTFRDPDYRKRTKAAEKALQDRAEALAGEVETRIVPLGPRHNHPSRDIKPLGACEACDRYWASREGGRVET